MAGGWKRHSSNLCPSRRISHRFLVIELNGRYRMRWYRCCCVRDVGGLVPLLTSFISRQFNTHPIVYLQPEQWRRHIAHVVRLRRYRPWESQWHLGQIEDARDFNFVGLASNDNIIMIADTSRCTDDEPSTGNNLINRRMWKNMLTTYCRSAESSTVRRVHGRSRQAERRQNNGWGSRRVAWTSQGCMSTWRHWVVAAAKNTDLWHLLLYS